MANILILDTTLDICSVALSQQKQEIIGFIEKGTNIHSARLTALIEKTINAAGLTYNSLDAVCVNKGPGSYTGLRIGVSAAKGLCYALDKPLLSLNTMEAMMPEMLAICAAGTHYDPGMLYCPMIDARRMEVYYAVMNASGEYIHDVQASVVDDIFLEDILLNNHILFFGNGMNKCRPILEKHKNALFAEQDIYPQAEWMAGPARRKFEAGDFENIFSFEPYYVKDFYFATK